MLVHAGQYERALNQLRFATQINPHFPDWYSSILGWTYYFLGEYEESIAEISNTISPSDDDFLILAACYIRKAEADAGAGDAARAEENRAKAKANVENFLKRRPDWTVDKHRRITPLQVKCDLEHYMESLRLAGLPEASEMGRAKD